MVRDLLERDKLVWHPFTELNSEIPNLLITHAEGAKLFDSSGASYIDAISSWWVNIHGHAHPAITEKISQQLKKLHHVIFAGVTHQPGVELAEKLLQILPQNYSKIFYSDNGSTAVEVALKLAIQYWKNRGEDRTTFIALDGSYHGDTFGAMSVAERGVFTEPFEKLLFRVNRIPRPTYDAINCVDMFKTFIAQEKIAGFIFEPLVQGASGMKMYPEEGLHELLTVCKEEGVLTIADEVMTGFGRTGPLFASSNFPDTLPDMICLSKGLSGGTMPIAATAISGKVTDAFLTNERAKMLLHGHSFTGNPIACAASLASLDLLVSEQSSASRKRIEESHGHFLAKLLPHPLVLHPRVCGTIFAFEVKASQNGYNSNIRDILYKAFLRRGVFLRPLGNTVYILPPYCITDEELNQVYTAILDTLNELKDNDSSV